MVEGNKDGEGWACGSLAATRPHLTSDSTGRLTSVSAEDKDYKAPVNRGVILLRQKKVECHHSNLDRGSRVGLSWMEYHMGIKLMSS